MKRLFTIALVLTLLMALVVPSAAFAKKGGMPASGKGKGNAPAVAPATEEPAAEAPAAEEPAPTKDKGKDKQKAKDAVEAPEDEAATEGDEPADEVEADDPADGEESEEAPGKLTGIENALSRLQRNLERKQAKFAAGEVGKLPKGLQSTIAKFMSWLGIDPAEEPADDEGSTETSPTVEPDPIDEPAPDTEAPAPDTDAPADTL